jgi:predicted hotdog family 3-hydroxylacyl-ACP dehydratase
VDVHAAALKHQVSAEDGIYAAQHAVYVAYLDDDSPSRQLRLGFDSSGRLLEVVVLLFDSGNELLIHAMKARAEYFDLLQ